MSCPHCSTDLPSGSQFCPFCGRPVSVESQMTTAMAVGAGAVAAGVGRLISSDSIPVGGLTPGTVLANRYRIIGLLGRGGMGEVYRADDLKLGQPVALKFLPAALSSDPVRRERFFAEVRITRQLAHPNICRVYDIAEVNGQHFLSMEFIDGEDLASLLKRIGYLPNEKALDVARQLVAGLAAAHERGVLHRDLKPSNIMIDGHGRVRITDFGLAVEITEDDQPALDVSGTPAYMAPEQLAGKGATVRSDIYALGQVLYETLSGRRAFTAQTIATLREEKEQSTRTAPSELRPGVDPIVERLVMRCLERDPRSRPASVAQLGAALPGGDPLAAAIAAGETPSPELVAASGLKEGLRPAVAVALLACVVVGSLTGVAMNRRTMLIERVAPGKSPEVLVERAREIIRNAGYVDAPADSAFGFDYDVDLIRYVDATNRNADRWNTLQTLNPVTFWYRQSPRSIERTPFMNWNTVTDIDPPLQFSGEVRVGLDPEGRLKRFDAVSPRTRSAAAGGPFDWTVLFSEAGVDLSTRTPAEPRTNPTTFADLQQAWTGRLATATTVPLQIEASAYRGQPVTFHIVGPWTREERTEAVATGRSDRVVVWVPIPLALAIMSGSVFYARRNLRLGRGDRRGALRLMLFALGMGMLGWVLGEHHVATPFEFVLFIASFSMALFMAGWFGVLYSALEPFVRRRWPHMLVSWTRVVLGSWRDPLVGRDVLIGCAAGVVAVCLVRLRTSAPSWFGFPEGPLMTSPVMDAFLGPLSFFNTLLKILPGVLLISLVAVFLLFFLRVILRSDWAAMVAWVVIQSFFLAGSGPIVSVQPIAFVGPIVMIESLLLFLVLKRFGLVAFMAALFVTVVFATFPMTFQASAWYAGYGYAALAVVAAVALYGFKTSLGGQPLVVGQGLDD